MSRQVCIHVCECLLLHLSFGSLRCLDAVRPAFIVARIEFSIFELAVG